VTGTARLPAPVGHVWALSTNVGEWHVLTEEGQYLARLFEPDPMRVRWPAEARPGAVLDAVPPGAGGEDFGGSLVQGRDGRLYVQAGKVALWNVEVTGLETVRALGGGTIEVTEDDVRRAAAVRVRLLQEATGTQTIAIRRVTPVFTGDLARDFAGAQVVRYEKQPSAAAASAAAWDDECLYLGWTVKDETPWVNGADAPHVLYARGDTVDFQVGADPSADEKRREAVRGDVRLSIGPLAGRPTAVAYRAVADEKSPRVFSSGVVAEYRMDSVQVLQDVRVHVKTSKGGYTVEAAVPLRTLGLVPRPGLRLRGDFGVTHGDAAGTDTMLRTGWNNQATGIVNDEVFELKMEPARWGLLLFQD